MKPSDIEEWLQEVKTKAGEGYDKVYLECRSISNDLYSVGLYTYLPDGNVMVLILPVKG